MSNKINKNLIINEVNEISDFDTEKVVVVTSTGELKQVDKSKVGIAEDKVTQIVSQKQEFVKNGAGWSHKYAKDNSLFYGEQGEYSTNLSFTDKLSDEENFLFGAIGKFSIALGIYSSAMGESSFVAGGENRSSGDYNHIISYGSRIIESPGFVTYGDKYCNAIFGGMENIIKDNNTSTIVGGWDNKIIGDKDPKFGYNYSHSNVIIGGDENTLEIDPSNTNAVVRASTIVGGRKNKAQGLYQFVSGLYNEAVTMTETLVGSYGTVQNKTLSGRDYIPTARMFNVGIGNWIGNIQDNYVRKDGFSVFWNGLVTAPSLTRDLINNNAKALTTNEWVKYQLDNYDYPIYRDLSSGGYATNQRKLAPDSFGKLGARALDFSFTTPLLIGNYGATGDYSFAHGLDLKSSGYSCVTFGRKNVNNGDFNVVNGEENTLTGSKQIVIGYKNQAKLIGGLVIGSNNNVMGQEALIVGRGIIKEVVDTESVIGWYNKDFTGDETERVFTIANGVSNEERSNALVVYKNGLIVAPSSTNQLINDDLTNKSLVTKEYLNPATLINILTSATADQKNQIKSLLGL